MVRSTDGNSTTPTKWDRNQNSGLVVLESVRFVAILHNWSETLIVYSLVVCVWVMSLMLSSNMLKRRTKRITEDDAFMVFRIKYSSSLAFFLSVLHVPRRFYMYRGFTRILFI